MPCSLLVQKGDTAFFRGKTFTGWCHDSGSKEIDVKVFKGGVIEEETHFYNEEKRWVAWYYEHGPDERTVISFDSITTVREITYHKKHGREKTYTYTGDKLTYLGWNRDIYGRKKGDLFKSHELEWDTLGRRTSNTYYRGYTKWLKPIGYETQGHYIILRENGKPCLRRKRHHYKFKTDCIKYLDW
ncbi:MAG TPA: hypothetical protein VI112_03265 [Bacteroidia bacterium]